MLRAPLASTARLAWLLCVSCVAGAPSANEPEPPVVVVTGANTPAATARDDAQADSPPVRRGKKVRRPEKDNIGPRTAISKIDPALLVVGPGMEVGEFQDVMIGLEKTSPTPEEAKLIRELHRGAARFGDERTRIERLVLAHRRARIRAQLGPVRDFIESMGGTVLWEGRAIFGLDASLTRAMVLRVAELPAVARLDGNAPLVESAHPG